MPGGRRATRAVSNAESNPDRDTNRPDPATNNPDHGGMWRRFRYSNPPSLCRVKCSFSPLRYMDKRCMMCEYILYSIVSQKKLLGLLDDIKNLTQRYKRNPGKSVGFFKTLKVAEKYLQNLELHGINEFISP